MNLKKYLLAIKMKNDNTTINDKNENKQEN